MAKEMRLVNANNIPLGKFINPDTEWKMGWNEALDAAASQEPTVVAVKVEQYNRLVEENEALRRRLQHLLQSEAVRMYDEIDPHTREYRRDIRQLDAVARIVGAGQKVERIKTCKNVEFDVIYDNGTRRHVTEGVLFEVENERIVFHNGTDRPEVIYATAEAAAEVVGNMNLPIHQLEEVIDRVLQKFCGSEGVDG